MTKVVGFHAGVVGLGLNFIVCALGTWIVPGTVSAMDRKAQVLPA
jgi:hypothetical protein